MYLSGRNCDVVMPLRELKGYKRVEVKKGDSVNVTIGLDAEAFSYLDQEMNFGMHNGDYTVLIGSASDRIAAAAEVKVRGGVIQLA